MKRYDLVREIKIDKEIAKNSFLQAENEAGSIIGGFRSRFKANEVKNGELVSFLTSRESAGKLGIPLTGNARSSVSDQPIVRMSNTFLEPGD